MGTLAGQLGGRSRYGRLCASKFHGYPIFIHYWKVISTLYGVLQRELFREHGRIRIADYHVGVS